MDQRAASRPTKGPDRWAFSPLEEPKMHDFMIFLGTPTGIFVSMIVGAALGLAMATLTSRY
jgi:hypothetical protein